MDNNDDPSSAPSVGSLEDQQKLVTDIDAHLTLMEAKAGCIPVMQQILQQKVERTIRELQARRRRRTGGRGTEDIGLAAGDSKPTTPVPPDPGMAMGSSTSSASSMQPDPDMVVGTSTPSTSLASGSSHGIRPPPIESHQLPPSSSMMDSSSSFASGSSYGPRPPPLPHSSRNIQKDPLRAEDSWTMEEFVTVPPEEEEARNNDSLMENVLDTHMPMSENVVGAINEESDDDVIILDED